MRLFDRNCIALAAELENERWSLKPLDLHSEKNKSISEDSHRALCTIASRFDGAKIRVDQKHWETEYALVASTNQRFDQYDYLENGSFDNSWNFFNNLQNWRLRGASDEFYLAYSSPSTFIYLSEDPQPHRYTLWKHNSDT